MAIRWIGIGGQLAAVVVVAGAFGFAMPIFAVLTTISAAAIFNLAVGVMQRARRVGDTELATHFAFDIAQLAVLLYFTGGLQNPFAMLMIAPVVVAAAVLGRNQVVLLASLALAGTVILSMVYRPLPWSEPGLDLPRLLVVGNWVAMATTLLFLVAYVWNVAHQARRMQSALQATQLALGREQKVAELGALAAAAAHELGTPLGTIAVVAKEMSLDLRDAPALADDLALLQSQVERCRDILAELSRNPAAEGADAIAMMPVKALVDSVAEPYRRPEIAFRVIERASAGGSALPHLRRSPELLHGLGNILQNAMQFAREQVTVMIGFEGDSLRLTVSDDGPGFSLALLDRLGEPYLSGRDDAGQRGHLGLGIFIAVTLLERCGADLAFANDPNTGGAVVAMRWTRAAIEQHNMQGA